MFQILEEYEDFLVQVKQSSENTVSSYMRDLRQFADMTDPTGRHLENEEAGIRYFWVKPSDVSIYVERGAADIGVAGKDILLEYEPDVY